MPSVTSIGEIPSAAGFWNLRLQRLSLAVFHAGHKEARFLAGSSSSATLLCSYRGPTYKHPILKASHDSPQSSLKGIPRNHRNTLWLSFCPKEELFKPHNSCKLHVQHKFPRDIVVRSELASTGSAGDEYSLSGSYKCPVWLNFPYYINCNVNSSFIDLSIAELRMGSKVRGACFYAVTAFAAIFLFILMVVGHPFVLLFDRHRRKFHHFVAKVWATLTVAPFFKIKFEGLENLPPPDTPAVYVSNHQSFLDIYTLLTLGRSFKFISKTGIFLYPIIGWAMFLLGTIPLKRMDSRSQLDCLKRCMDIIKKGASVFFFPEGTRSKGGKLGSFKKGAFSVAAKTHAPVVPITLIGTGQIMPAGREGIVSLGSVKVVIHKPIDGNDPNILCNEARKTIASALTQT